MFTRLRGAHGANDSRSTSAKAEAADSAVKWAVKNGVKGDRPALKKQDDWLRALDGAREDYVKELNVRHDKLSSAVRERQFRGIEAVVKGSKDILDRVLVIKYLPEKSNDIRIAFVDRLKLTITAVHSESRIIESEIRQLEKERDALPATSGKIRQIGEKIKLKNKQVQEGVQAVTVLNLTIQSIRA